MRISPNRILVQDTIIDAFLGKVKAVVTAIDIDQGLRKDFVVGLMISTAGLEKVACLVEQANALAAAELPAFSSHLSWNNLGERNAGKLCGGQEAIQALSVTRAG